MAQDANLAKQALMLLKDVYLTNSIGVLSVTKGIHRPTDDPHMQLRVDEDFQWFGPRWAPEHV